MERDDMTNDERVSAAINQIRRQHGNPMDQCPSCTCVADAPFRSYDMAVSGKIEMGCVDAFHTGRLRASSVSEAWHTRPWAKAFRKAELQKLRSL